jgi:hypothetical protein
MLDRFEKAKHVKREVRRARSIIARVIADGLNAECHVSNYSQHSAILETALATALPPKFELAFSGDEMIRRQCSVVWRRGRMVGVQFI